MTSDEKHDLVMAIRNTRGMNAKMNLLRKHPEMKNILRTTYNPYMQFNIKVPRGLEGCYAAGATQFTDETATLLVRLAHGSLSGTSARQRIAQHMGTLTPKSADLFRMIINKSFDFGLAIKSINKVFPDLIPVHMVQRAKTYESKRCSFPMLTSPKLDGLRGTNKYSDGKFYSRNGHKLMGLTRVEQAVGDYLNSAGYVNVEWDLDGELMVRGQHFNEISGQIRAFTEADDAQFFVYDIIGLDKPLDERLAILAKIFPTSMGKEEHGEVFYLEHIWCHSEESVMDMHQLFLDMGHEGSVVKNPNSVYQDARTYDWMKIKVTNTEDLVVTGVFEGQGKYHGMLGGIVVNFRGVDVRVGSGLSDDQRMFWAQDPDEIIGKTVEVAYHEITPAGSLRHPRLKTIRGDK